MRPVTATRMFVPGNRTARVCPVALVMIGTFGVATASVVDPPSGAGEGLGSGGSATGAGWGAPEEPRGWAEPPETSSWTRR